MFLREMITALSGCCTQCGWSKGGKKSVTEKSVTARWVAESPMYVWKLHGTVCILKYAWNPSSPFFFFTLLHGNRTLWVRADTQGVQRTGGTQLRQEPWRENKRPAACCINKKQIKDLEEEEKDTALLAGRITILGRFLSFVLKLYCLVSYVL